MSQSDSTDDDRDLVRAGYRPLFRRGLGGFAAFAAGFSYLSILTGIVQNFHLGYREAGPAFFWTWPVVFAGQLCVALCFAELARRYPYCGGVYAWAGRVGAPSLGWLVGWIYLASLVVTLAAVALAWQVMLPALWPGFQVLDTPARNAALLGVVLIALSTFLNVRGTRLLARVMAAGVVVELIAAVALIALLCGHAVRGPGVVLEARASAPGGGLGPFLAAAVMAAYVMYGFDTAGSLAEETVDPRRRAPRAILQALLAAAALGALLLIGALTSAPDLTDPLLSDGAGGLPYLIKGVLGDALGTVFVAAAALAVFVCTLAVHALAARTLFAMARDGATPFAGRLSRVHPEHRTPHTAAAAVGVLGCALLAFNSGYEQLMTALVCVSIVWTNLAYLLTTGALLVERLRSGPTPDSFLGRCGTPVNALAVVWGAALVVNIGWPREQLYGPEWYQRYGAALYTGALLIAGAVVYRTVRRSA
ncbi:Putrescine importer PuuP [Gemmata obscuriglobus]|nr:APC family permease [Gemmata obscuriglobus]QEG30967.1 Putrescine importer PuuP [Gemmata obscuriglobus]VTS10300.1 amino acid permease : Amino acid transporter OS=Singulisphaera acidiphila (strain ATCC BAA-1392 / DSM 18658 / VKM B-2454 / MOB10) GN=Sinac_5704 PE=4 SV=1: AA_permease_2 [Gemmata obscuriglobus UQM 2246]